ncbi:hypothetical protein HJB99_08275 [Rhizobium sp. NLR17b]|uniref:hypothetical protein n=1 Tax=Rhizobium sp. NLR17b TaxID=2731114 RepID=UPI001C82F0A5|nr:hypothetical protein [Rhizobium sp. NLR17b]MBX5268669.1 hypothetical protein [Rhizobium sp. NLR17b]
MIIAHPSSRRTQRSKARLPFITPLSKEWNQFYRENANPTQQQLLNKATEIDSKYGAQFNPPVR